MTTPVLGTLSEMKPMALPELLKGPLVSVLIANYNNAIFLPVALDSMLAQTYTNWEAIICDDGSTDNSRHVIESYLARDSRFRCVLKENGGVATALNAAFSGSKGEIVALLDADDYCFPNKIEEIVKALRANEKAGFVGHPLTPVDATGKTIGLPIPHRLDDGWLAPKAFNVGGRCWLPPAGGLAFRRKLAELLFPIPDEFRKRAADGYLFGVAQFASIFVALQLPLSAYRFHSTNITAASKPTVQSIEKTLDDYEKIACAQRRFLSQTYGESFAQMLSVDASETYLQNLLAYRVLTGTLPGGARASSVSKVLSGLHSTSLRWVWNTMLLLPPRLAREALYIWHGQYPGKQLLRPLARITGLK